MGENSSIGAREFVHLPRKTLIGNADFSGEAIPCLPSFVVLVGGL